MGKTKGVIPAAAATKKYVEAEDSEVAFCPGCKRLGDHAAWCPVKNRPGPGVSDATD